MGTYNLELLNGAYYITSEAGRGKKISKHAEEDDEMYANRATKEFDEHVKSLKGKKEESTNVVKSAKV